MTASPVGRLWNHGTTPEAMYVGMFEPSPLRIESTSPSMSLRILRFGRRCCCKSDARGAVVICAFCGRIACRCGIEVGDARATTNIEATAATASRMIESRSIACKTRDVAFSNGRSWRRLHEEECAKCPSQSNKRTKFDPNHCRATRHSRQSAASAVLPGHSSLAYRFRVHAGVSQPTLEAAMTWWRISPDGSGAGRIIPWSVFATIS